MRIVSHRKLTYNQYNNKERRPEDMNETYYYFFDCLDGCLGERYLTPGDVHRIQYGTPGTMTERELIRTAANYEATLYRYKRTDAGEFTEETILYDIEF